MMWNRPKRKEGFLFAETLIILFLLGTMIPGILSFSLRFDQGGATAERKILGLFSQELRIHLTIWVEEGGSDEILR